MIRGIAESAINVNPGATADEVAQAVLDEIPDTGWREAVFPAVKSYVDNIQRERALAIEREAFHSRPEPPRSNGRGAAARSTDDPLDRLMDTLIHIPLGNGEWAYIPWGDCTTTNLRARAQYLRKQAAGLIESAERCEETARLLDDAGVTCLRELSRDKREALMGLA